MPGHDLTQARGHFVKANMLKAGEKIRDQKLNS
jgi:hypothetical protein